MGRVTYFEEAIEPYGHFYFGFLPIHWIFSIESPNDSMSASISLRLPFRKGFFRVFLFDDSFLSNKLLNPVVPIEKESLESPKKRKEK